MIVGTPVQPKLDDLLSRYLQRRTEAQRAGLASFDAGEVTPYDAGPVQPIDAKLAWDEARLALEGTGESAPLEGADRQEKAPAGWAQVVASHEPMVALAMCVGNFPQMVRNFHQILQKADLAELQPQGGRAAAVPGLEEWVEKAAADEKPGRWLLALGMLRLAKQFEAADTFIEANKGRIPEQLQAAWENEKAALAWHRGETEKARTMWDGQKGSVAVLFNRGMANLFLGRTEMARESLRQVVERIPEASAWHHLARLYLTLAESR